MIIYVNYPRAAVAINANYIDILRLDLDLPHILDHIF